MVSMSGLGWPSLAKPLSSGTEAVCHFVKSFLALVVKAVNSGWPKMAGFTSAMGSFSAA